MAGQVRLAGILNVTPDSFSDGGRFGSVAEAVTHALEMIRSGIDIIDVGGESTRPGAAPVSAEDEIGRTIPVIKGILEEVPGAVISIDTYKSSVAEAALNAGAKIVNDISGGSFDTGMWDVVAEKKVPYILMHTSGTPAEMQQKTGYINVVDDVLEWLLKRAEAAKKAGVAEVIIDPGIGFGKTPDQNLQLISSISKFRGRGYQVLIGLSRKSFLGKALGYDLKERDLPGSYFEFFCAMNGADIIRTHNTGNALIYRRIAESLHV
ncbi:MAG: dihydropteroate synthase [Ignavibacteriaceae bacterium]|nr:MAG: dihydropteroate synthase [Ignavibacteriaceae bacterium]